MSIGLYSGEVNGGNSWFRAIWQPIILDNDVFRGYTEPITFDLLVSSPDTMVGAK